jgi:hypothetical protein
MNSKQHRSTAVELSGEEEPEAEECNDLLDLGEDSDIEEQLEVMAQLERAKASKRSEVRKAEDSGDSDGNFVIPKRLKKRKTSHQLELEKAQVEYLFPPSTFQ